MDARPMPGGPTGQAAALGFVAGLRSQVPGALLAVALSRDPDGARVLGPAGRLLASPRGRSIALLAAAELLADKLPTTPSRTRPGPLLGRLTAGGLVAAGVARRAGTDVRRTAAIGAGAAAVGSLAGQGLRAALGRATGLPDPVVAVVEDALAVGLGAWSLGLVGGSAA